MQTGRKMTDLEAYKKVLAVFLEHPVLLFKRVDFLRPRRLCALKSVRANVCLLRR